MTIRVSSTLPVDTLISVDGVGKSFTTESGKDILALDDVSFGIRPGEFVSVVGPSGCGKSTLLKIIAGLTPPTSGSVEIEGSPVAGPRDDIGIVFQAPLLLPWRTVRENALLPLEMQGKPKLDYADRLERLLKLVGLDDFGDKYPYELSGGMQQRASITRALVPDPSILLMDEPFGALDAMLREMMNVELQRIWMDSKKTVCFITHSIPEAVFLSDVVIALSRRPGRIADITRIDLPRPRDLTVMGSDDFGAYTGRIRGQLDLNPGVDL